MTGSGVDTCQMNKLFREKAAESSRTLTQEELLEMWEKERRENVEIVENVIGKWVKGNQK